MTIGSTGVSPSGRAALTVVLMVSAMLFGACGGSDDGKLTSSDAAHSSAPAAGVTATNATGDDGAFCDAVEAQFAQLSSAGDASSLDAAVRQQYFVMQMELTAKVREAAPSGLRSDVEIQTRPSDGLADGRIRGDAAATAQMRSPETQAAVSRVSAYVKDHCGFEATTKG